ncbi:MAG: Fic family protein [Nitrospira sp.]|nr:Fic family protein [bacterium]MBL7049443.1 Fic family protein [Nitrospira sp.]
MKKTGRYDVSRLTEAQFEPGSRGRVLVNKLGIKRKREMDRLEREELERTLDELYGMYDETHRFTFQDIRTMHKLWLGSIYEWAGEYRQVNIGKDGFMFASAAHVPELMTTFEQEQLTRYTPCHFTEPDETAYALASVHVELILIHPFREGNGRTARLLADVMAAQAGLPPLDFTSLVRRKRDYIAAVQAGMDSNYEPMKNMFMSVIRRTLKLHGQEI